jgi:hypothetical protein
MDFQLCNEIVYLRENSISIDAELFIDQMEERDIERELTRLKSSLELDPTTILDQQLFDKAKSCLK